MTYAELDRTLQSGKLGDLDYSGNELTAPIYSSLGEQIGVVTFEDTDEELEFVNLEALKVEAFDFI